MDYQPPSSIYSYLLTISAHDIEDLYRTPYCALAVLQSLTALSRTLVMRLISLRVAITEDFLRAWLKPGPEGDTLCSAVLVELRALHILRPPSDTRAMSSAGVVDVGERGITAFELSPVFRDALAEALAGGADAPWAAESAALPPLAAEPPSIQDIERQAAGRWHSVLHYLLGTADAAAPNPKVTELLVSTGLLAPGADPDLGADGVGAKGRAMVGDALGAARVGGTGANASAFLAGDEGEASVPKRRRPLTYAEIYEAGDGETHMTRAGYEFLLKETGVQLWTFLHAYIRTAGSRGIQATDILAGLFQLGFCRMGEGYALSALSRSQLALFEDFAAFGLVVIPHASSRAAASSTKESSSQPARPDRFYPSSLAISLSQHDDPVDYAAAASAAQAEEDEINGGVAEKRGATHGFVAAVAPVAASAAFMAAAVARESRLSLVVETNFKLYAYTKLGLHVALLALFARIDTRLPNLVVATLTRSSILHALHRGISVRAIAAFLAARLRPEQAALGVPENVEAQLTLWEKERERVSSFKAALLGPLASDAEWMAARRAAGDKAVLWENRSERTLVVSLAVASQVELAIRAAGSK